MIHVLLLLLALAAFQALCAGLPRHQQALFRRKLDAPATRGLRVAGWVLLVALYACAWAAYGFGRGTVLTAGYATVGALAAVAVLNRRQAR